MSIILFFFLCLSANTTDNQNSIETSTLSAITNSFYDKDFIFKTINYFKENYNYDILLSTKSLHLLFYIKKTGVYRTELIFLIKFSYDKKIDIEEIYNEIKNKKTDIFEITKRQGYDINTNFKKAIEIRKIIEKEINDTKNLKEIIEKNFK